ncbi:MAG: glycosyltransferase family 4 protein [bacterium]|nr:glycosyltransferase family 4 protein [bacterium]
MKIAVDLTQIPCEKTGVGVYAVNLVKEMCRLNQISKKFDFYFFIQDDDLQLMELVEGRKRCSTIAVKSKAFRKLLRRVCFEQILLPRQCRKLGIDLIFSSHYTTPYFTRIKRVAAFHDMTFYLFPQLHQIIRRIYFKALIPMSTKRCSGIITVSQATKNDIKDRFKKLDPDKMTVIHHGVDDFAQCKGNVASASEMESIPPAGEKPQAEDVLEKYRLQRGKYFLFVGTLEPRKNIDSIIKAFHHVKHAYSRFDDATRLVIVGKKGWFYDKIFETVEKLGVRDFVVFTGYVTEEEKKALLKDAFLFVYPSFYEGFGLPVLEAMICGTPVITANISALPEVAGDAALLIDPHRWRDIAEAMLRLLSDIELRAKLTRRGEKQAKRFSWEKSAEKTLALFEKILKENSSNTTRPT